MKDPTFTTEDFLKADQIIHHLIENLALDFRINGQSFTRDQMETNVRKREALIQSRNLLIEEGERIITPSRSDG